MSVIKSLFSKNTVNTTTNNDNFIYYNIYYIYLLHTERPPVGVFVACLPAGI